MPPQLVLTILLLLAVPGQGMAETLRQESASPRGQRLSPELLAQAPLPQDSFTMPEGVPWGTTIRVDGDPSNAPTNRILQQGFKQRFPGAAIQLASRGSDVAVQGVLDGDLDIAALGRRLTSQERAKGLVAIPLARHKIAVIISPDNPFSGSLTNTQFAQIFRGEITDWEEIGGEPGPIRLIDRPETSDTRRAFSNYPVFQSAPFQAGESSIQVNDRTDDVIKALGSDGIGYAIVDQVSARDDLTIVPLHDVLPDDPRYSFSQPLAYVYKGPVPNPAAQAFLGYANTASQSGDLVASRTAAAAFGSAGALTGDLDSFGNGELNATEAEGANALGSVDSETAAELGLNAPVAQVGQTTAATGRAPWWLLLLPLAVIPFLFRWMKRGSGPLAWGTGISGRGETGAALAGPDAEASGLALGGTALAGAGLAGAGLAGAGLVQGRRVQPQLVLAARDCHHAYAYWELSEEQRAAFQEKGGQALKLRVFDVTRPIHGDRPFRQYDCDLQGNDLEIPIRHDNHFYRAELGYLTATNEWLPVADCQTMRVPACEVRSSHMVPGGDAGLETPHQRNMPLKPPMAAPVAGSAAGATAAPKAVPKAAPEATPRTPATPGMGVTGGIIAGGAGLAAGAAAMASSSGPSPESNSPELANANGQAMPKESGHGTVADGAVERSMAGDAMNLEVVGAGAKTPAAKTPAAKTPAAKTPAAKRSRLENPKADSPEAKLADGDNAERENAELKSPERQTPDRPEVQRYTQERYTADPGAAHDAPAQETFARQLSEHSLAADSVEQFSDEQSLDGQSSDEQSPKHDSLQPSAPLPGAIPLGGEDRTWVTLTPLSSRQAQVNWHISQEHRQQLKAQGGKHLQMKIHDADQIDLDVQPAHSTHTYPCDEGSEVRRVELPYSDRDYVAEIGYMTEDQQWLRVARSVHSHSPTPDYDGCRIVIMPCDPHRLIRRGPDTLPQAYAYWDISEERRQVLRQQGGQMLVLRVYDADQIDLDQQDAHHTEEFVIDELARDKVVEVPHGDRDYVAEIGYRTLEGEFLSLGRSLHARIPQVKSSAS